MERLNSLHTPSFVQVFQWATRPSDFLDACTSVHGDIFTVKFPGDKPLVFISHPKALEQIFTAPPGTFQYRECSEILRPYMGEHSLLLLEGKSHQRQRKMLMPPFHGERMRVYGKLTCDLTEQMMKTWKVGEAFNLHSCMRSISLNIILHAVFGLVERERSEQLSQKLSVMLKMISTPVLALHIFLPPLQKDWGFWSVWGRFIRLRNEVDRLLYAEIAQRRKQLQPERTDILNLMIAARDEEGQPMSDEELRDQLMTLLLSGQDTTTTAMTWAFYWIHKIPRVRKRLVEELDTITNSSDIKAIIQLPYLTATCQETLRFYPSIIEGFPRVAKTPFEIMGYKFPVGSRLCPNIYSAHHRKEVYPEPEMFLPERFLEKQFSHYEFLPFGGGERLCIGQAFSQFQMKMMLFTILSRYELALDDPRPIHPIRRGPGLAPSRDLRMIVAAPHQLQANAT